MVRLALDGGEDGSGVPVGVDEDDLAGIVDGDDVDAFEGDGLAVFAGAAAGPLDGGGVAVEKDTVFGEADVLEEAEDAGDEVAEGFMAVEGWGADGVVAGGGRGEGIEPSVDVHGAEGGEVFGYSLGGGDGHGEDFTCFLRR